MSSEQSQTVIKESGLIGEIEQLYSDFIQLEKDFREDERGRPIASYTMTDWDRLTSRLKSLPAKIKKDREEMVKKLKEIHGLFYHNSVEARTRLAELIQAQGESR